MCQHQFFEIMKISQARNIDAGSSAISNRWPETYGVKCGCIICGEIRSVWENGNVEINTPGHEPL